MYQEALQNMVRDMFRPCTTHFSVASRCCREPIDNPVEVRTRCFLTHNIADTQSCLVSLRSSSLEFMGRVVHASARVRVLKLEGLRGPEAECAAR